MKAGVQWEVSKGVPASEVLKFMTPFFKKRSPIVALESRRTETHEMICYTGQYGDGLFEMQEIIREVQEKFGFQVERIARWDGSGDFIPWKDYFDELGRRYDAMPKPRGYDR
jgi:hypothetical protein